MMTDKYQYEALVDDALRGVVRHVLVHAAERGLPGTHHFYISFRTSEPGVEMPDYLRAKYPDEMTIVLQHQYWGLEVSDEAFEVTVSFNKRNERLKVPFVALSAFVDPSVRFGLQFEKRGTAAQSLPAPDKRPALVGPVSQGEPARHSNEATAASPPPDDESKSPAAGSEQPVEGGAKVVTLDAFRKKP